MTVRVKICGITSSEQAQMAQQYGADALGLVIYEKSPRYVNLEQAAKRCEDGNNKGIEAALALKDIFS